MICADAKVEKLAKVATVGNSEVNRRKPCRATRQCVAIKIAVSIPPWRAIEIKKIKKLKIKINKYLFIRYYCGNYCG